MISKMHGSQAFQEVNVLKASVPQGQNRGRALLTETTIDIVEISARWECSIGTPNIPHLPSFPFLKGPLTSYY
ncbi:hypothetical protein N779_04800 [Vibrio coralliilyticus OCN008]|nr:hypothetical protein N779_04800 [Vibrio coralliilyticus OCN008]